MPRGTDAATISREQAGAYGDDVLNAEELIRSNQANQDPALQRILAMGENFEASEEVRANLTAWSEKFDLDEGEVLMDAAVHGNTVVGVIEGADGRTRKAYVGLTEDWTPPKLSSQEQARRAAALREQQVARETAKARAEAEARIREAEEQIARERDERIAALRAQADAEVEAEEEAARERTAKTAEPEAEVEETAVEDEAEEPSASQSQQFPSDHASLDELAKQLPTELPDDWSDTAKWPVARKQEFIAETLGSKGE